MWNMGFHDFGPNTRCNLAGKEEAVKTRGGPSSSEQPGDESARELVAVLGGEITLEAARKLLRACGGNLQRAANAHYDSLEGRGPAVPKPTKSVPKAQGSPAVRFPLSVQTFLLNRAKPLHCLNALYGICTQRKQQHVLLQLLCK